MQILDRSEIIREFREWDKEGIPELVAAYGKNHGLLIVRVFTFVKEAEGWISGADESSKVDVEYTFPIAKILQVGNGWKNAPGDSLVGYEAGKYVRLRDIDAMAYPNARYEVWINHQYKNAMATGIPSQIGSPEPRVVMNLWKNLGSRLFNPDPFDHTSEGWLSNVFFLDEGNVVMPVEDVEALLTGKFFIQK